MERVVDFLKSIGDDPVAVGIMAFLGASFSGLATQLKHGKTLTLRSISAAMLNSGFIGIIIFLLGYKMFIDNLPYLIGMSLLAGIGGSTILEFIIVMIKKRSSITIKINSDD